MDPNIRASYPLPPFDEAASELVAHRKQRAKRPAALRRAERELLKIREALQLVGYQEGDEVFFRLGHAIRSIQSDLRSSCQP